MSIPFLKATCAALAVFALAALFSSGAPAQQKKRPNDPTTDPYCPNDPELMKAAGIVSMGGFPFGKLGSTTTKVDETMSVCDIRWVETEHFRIGFALGSYKVKLEEKKKILAELARLKEVLPKVPAEIGILDPWLRMHLYAMRCEDTYKRFLEIVHGDELTFPPTAAPYNGAYIGSGPYLGMAEKYELIILPSEAAHVAFLLDNFGLRIRNTQRWHIIERGCITVSMHQEQGQLRSDPALHGHVVFNLSHNLWDGLLHYSYDTPVWLHEGLAHWMEREIDPDHNSFDSGEGATADMTSKKDWKPEVIKLIVNEQAPRLADLLGLKSYAELKLVHHYVTWSMVDFLMTTKPAELAKFMVALKRHFDEKGIPTGDGLPDWHRKQFKECLGWNYAEFDEAWRAWAQATYRQVPGKANGDPNGGTPTRPGPPGVPPH